MFLIVIDAHSKWLNIIPIKTATALTTVQRLQMLFSRFGVPESMVSDNGPQFAAAEFQELCRRNGIRHILIAPYHPASMAWQNEVCKHSREATRNSRKGLWKIVWLDLCCNMLSRHTQPLDIVPRSYYFEESYALIWT